MLEPFRRFPLSKYFFEIIRLLLIYLFYTLIALCEQLQVTEIQPTLDQGFIPYYFLSF